LDSGNPELEGLQRRLDEEEAAYAECLRTLDQLASFPLPEETLKDLAWQMGRLNALWQAPPRPDASGLGGAFRSRAFDAVAPAIERQTEFNSILVQALNGQVGENARLHAHLRTFVAALLRYLQRLQPLVDARDRTSSAHAVLRAELSLEAFDRRLESLARRLEGLLTLRERTELLGEQMRALQGALQAAPAPVRAAAHAAAESATYTAFERRFRGTPEQISERLSGYVELFKGQAPVLELGCGAGEFLELLRAAGVAARGVEQNPGFVAECRARGLEVVPGDLLALLRSLEPGSLGGVFAAQVAEHLAPAALQEALRECHRVLRPGGLLLLETVNTRSVYGLLEVFLRDLSHEKPLHPDTLSFLAAAAGFADVRVEPKSPVEASTRLQPVPVEGLPPRAAGILNENLERLNAILFGAQEYALIARR
jgi:O-antigen chain-terminating methyltransferase